MTTNEFIKELKKADPEGNCHVRLNGECPICVERKPGYYDGAYTYIEDGKFHVSTKGDKVDVMTYDLEWWLADYPPSTVVTHLYPAAQERFEKDFAKLLLTLED